MDYSLSSQGTQEPPSRLNPQGVYSELPKPKAPSIKDKETRPAIKEDKKSSKAGASLRQSTPRPATAGSTPARTSRCQACREAAGHQARSPQVKEHQQMAAIGPPNPKAVNFISKETIGCEAGHQACKQ